MKVASPSGVTLLELLVALGLFAVLAGVAAPYMGEMRAALEVRSSTLRVAAALRKARVAALAQGRTWVLRVVDGSSFDVGAEGTEGTRTRLEGRARFLSTTAGGEVRFGPGGWAGNATFVVGIDDDARRVVVNQRGRIVIRRPEGAG